MAQLLIVDDKLDEKRNLELKTVHLIVISVCIVIRYLYSLFESVLSDDVEGIEHQPLKVI